LEPECPHDSISRCCRWPHALERCLVGCLLDHRLAPDGRRGLATRTGPLSPELVAVASRGPLVQQSTNATDFSQRLRTVLSLPPARAVGGHDSRRLRLASLRTQDPTKCS